MLKNTALLQNQLLLIIIIINKYITLCQNKNIVFQDLHDQCCQREDAKDKRHARLAQHSCHPKAIIWWSASFFQQGAVMNCRSKGQMHTNLNKLFNSRIIYPFISGHLWFIDLLEKLNFPLEGLRFIKSTILKRTFFFFYNNTNNELQLDWCSKGSFYSHVPM